MVDIRPNFDQQASALASQGVENEAGLLLALEELAEELEDFLVKRLSSAGRLMARSEGPVIAELVEYFRDEWHSGRSVVEALLMEVFEQRKLADFELVDEGAMESTDIEGVTDEGDR